MPENTQKRAKNLQPMWSKERREWEVFTYPSIRQPVREKTKSQQNDHANETQTEYLSVDEEPFVPHSIDKEYVPAETQANEKYLPVDEEVFIPESIYEGRGIPVVLINFTDYTNLPYNRTFWVPDLQDVDQRLTKTLNLTDLTTHI